MFPVDTLLAYVAACLLVVISPGPDNILAVSRGLSQGRMAAALSSLGAGLGIMFHTLAATVGLSLLIQNSPAAFEEAVGLGKRRLQSDRSGPFFAVFLSHSGAMGLQIRQKLSSLGPLFAFDVPSPTAS